MWESIHGWADLKFYTKFVCHAENGSSDPLFLEPQNTSKYILDTVCLAYSVV